MSTCGLQQLGSTAVCGAPVTHVWHSIRGVPWGDRLEPGAALPRICDTHAAALADDEAAPILDHPRRTRGV